jgi:serine/threonine protein kinase
MENKSGTNLAELIRLRRNAPFPPQEALVFLKAISASLAYIHGRGLVHGDIKPENVTIDPQGKVFLSGVGFAQPIGSKSTVRRPVEYVPHLAPELIGEEIVTEATDVFSLGVLYYQIITGEIPSPGAKSLATPHQLNPSISESLSQVVMRSFAQYPLERYATPQDFFAAVCDTLRVAAANPCSRIKPPW